MDLKETEILGSDIGDHWYYRSKVKAMECFLGGYEAKSILDVGAGSGFFSKHLLGSSAAVDACCVDISYLQESDELFKGKQVKLRKSIESSDADLVLLMDVLEHVDDDVGLLREYVEKVPEGSRFLMTVPAFNFLWSAHDDFLEHKRRYTLEHFERVVKEAGLEINRGAYYFGGVFPIAATLRLMERFKKHHHQPGSQLKRHSWLVNVILKGICALELPLMKFNRLCGLSVFCLAEKTATPSRRDIL